MDFDAAVLGGGLAPEVQALIAEAGVWRGRDEARAQDLLLQARALAPSHPATLIALYRFHFYGHRLPQAREVAIDALRIARTALEPHADAADVLMLHGTVDDEQARFDAAVRFYLFSLKGYAYLSLRLGDLDQGRQALSALRRLDPQDRVGGGVLAQVLARAESDESDDEERPSQARGWSAP